ncbi:MATE family efflux transporter [Bacillus carboniphilus]|uniref:MATE family efflux transporter n=1 Tax=Bacillus carboniphilus TaxID=86663 RepID=UPI003FCDA969
MRGAALGTIMAMMINLILFVILSYRYIFVRIENILIYLKCARKNLKESIPLIGQELLEGGVFIIAVNALIARIGTLELSAYLLVGQIISVILMPMYMYSTSLLTLVSERYSVKEKSDLHSLPKISFYIVMIYFISLSSISFIFRLELVHLITDDLQLIEYSMNILLMVIALNLFNPLHSVYKYCLQAIGKSNFVLKETAKINFVTLTLMIFLSVIFDFKLQVIFISLFMNYLCLSMIFYKKYAHSINHVSIEESTIAI